MPVYRRRKEMKTNYAKRLSLLKSKTNRLVLRLSNTYCNLEYVLHNPKGDLIKFSISSKSIKKFGWNKGFKSLPACYLTGYLFGKEINKLKLEQNLILDLGLQHAFPKGRIFATVKGAIDADIKLSVDEKMIPSEDRISGKHINAEELFKKVKTAIDKM